MLSRVSVVLPAVLLILAGCSGEPDDKPKTGPVVPTLEAAWEIRTQPLFDDLDQGRGDGLWDDGESFSLVGETTVLTHATATGAVESVIQLPQKVCAASPDLNEMGIGVVVVAPEDEDDVLGPCSTVIAIDTRAGRILWRKRVPEVAYLNDVTIGRRVIAVTDAGAGARRLAVRDGRQLRTLGSGESTSNGALIAATEGSGSRTLDIYDQDSGAVVQRSALRSVYGLDAIVGDRPDAGTEASPILVAVDGPDGTYLRDVTGARARTVGRDIEPRNGLVELAVGDTPVIQYPGSLVVDRWNPATRSLEKIATLADDESLIGVRDGRLLTQEREVAAVSDRNTVIQSIDPDDPADPLVLGTLDSSIDGLVDVVDRGALVVGQNNNELIAFRLPDDGVPISQFGGADPGKDYVSADLAGDLCVGIRPESLTLAGIVHPGAEPANCQYDYAAGGSESSLYISSESVEPDGKVSAIDAAATTFAANAAGASAQLQPVEDTVGDETAIDRADRILFVRVDNVVIRVALIDGPETAAARRTALIAVARDLLAELDSRRAAG